ncbi:MAG: serine protease [Thiobacillus sp. 65-1059]|nr:MAG: serine protease [Thiobacillus sp. 65-1059]
MLLALLAGYAGFGEAAPASASAQGNKPPAVVEKAAPYVGWARGRLLVAPRAGLSAGQFEQALKSVNGRSKGYIRQLNTHVVELSTGADEAAAMRELRKNRKLKYVELDMAVAPAASVSDPAYGNSWALPKIQAPAAWDSANGSGVTIAILDTGIDSAHPDLAPNLVPGWNVYDNNSNTADVNGHGTWVAGVAAMAANNAKGSAGVAWGAKIMPVRIADANAYAYWSTVAQGIYWAADHGAKVVNVSYNGVSGSATVQSAAQYLRSKGGVVVVAAGNSGGLESIAASDALLSVAATDQNDARASFSSYGAYVDLAAPGVSVYTTTVGGGYSNASGTSFSSPVVAATAALMLSANGKLTPADVDRILKTTSLDLGAAGYDQYYGSGRVNAAAAVLNAKQTVAADTQAPSVSIASPTGGRVSGVVPVDVNYSDNVGVTRADFYVNGQLAASDSLAPFAFAWDTAGKADGSYTLSVQAYDAAGNRGTSPSVAVTVGNDSIAPTIGSFSLTDGMTISPSKQTVSVSATDNQGVAKISLVIDGKEVALAYGGTLSYNWNTRKLAKGAHTVTVRVTDNAGNATSRTVTVYK